MIFFEPLVSEVASGLMSMTQIPFNFHYFRLFGLPSILFIVPANTNFPLFESSVSNYRLRVHDSDAAEKKKAIFESEIKHCNLNRGPRRFNSHKSHTRAHPERRKSMSMSCEDFVS